MLKFIRNKLLKQYDTGAHIGGLKDLALRTMVYVTAMNFILLVITAYSVSLRSWMAHYVTWFNFPVFLGILIGLLLLAMLIEYKFILPSTWHFINQQQYEHKNLIRRDLNEISRRLDGIEKQIGVQNGKHHKDETNLSNNS